MRTGILYSAAACALAAMCIGAPQAFAVADLSGWVGELNIQPNPTDPAYPNNFGLISTTSAGGTFRARQTRATTLADIEKSSFSDDSLQNSPVDDPNRYGFTEPLTASGTFTFANPNNVDANWFFGFYNSEPGTQQGIQRLGIGVGDVSTGNFRIQANACAGAAAGAGIFTESLTTTGAHVSGAPAIAIVPAGTYSFNLAYTPASGETLPTFDVSITDGATTWFRNFSLTTDYIGGDQLDRFGFLQFGDQHPIGDELENQKTFTFTVSNIDYSGATAAAGSTPGDFNHDGSVNASDLVTWTENFGPTAGADADGDGRSDGADFLIWQRNAGSSGVSAVPEPGCSILILAGFMALGACRRRRG